jgi:hypothetical protein
MEGLERGNGKREQSCVAARWLRPARVALGALIACGATACAPCPPRGPALITGGRTLPRPLLGRYEVKHPTTTAPARAEHDRNAPPLAAPTVQVTPPPSAPNGPNGPKIETAPLGRVQFDQLPHEVPETPSPGSPPATTPIPPSPGTTPRPQPVPPSIGPPATLPEEVILRLIETGKPRFVRCFQKAFADDPTMLSVKVRLRIELDADAKLTSATTDSPTTSLSDCLTRAAAWLRYPTTGRRTLVEMPLFYRVE